MYYIYIYILYLLYIYYIIFLYILYLYIYIYIYIMKTMCPPGYHHKGFEATHALGHMMHGLIHI